MAAPRWETADAEINFTFVENPELPKVLPLKSGVGQNIVLIASLTARDFFLSNFYRSGSFNFTFPKPLPRFFSSALVWLEQVPV